MLFYEGEEFDGVYGQHALLFVSANPSLRELRDYLVTKQHNKFGILTMVGR